MQVQYSLKEGKYDGVCTFYWSNGNTAHEAFFEDGGCSGEIFFYYPNGQIQAFEQFKNNVRHGLCTQFSEDGTIVFNSRYGCSTIPCAFGGLPCLNSQPVAIPAPDPVIAVVVPTLRSTSPAARYARLRPLVSDPLSLKSKRVALESPVVFEYAQNSTVKSVLVPNPRSPLEAVSYTHLTLPTSDLV